MATFRKVPARIITIDYVGIGSVAASKYRKQAESELSKLEGMVARGKLKQGVRKVSIAPNVEVECTVMFELTQAVVVIGAHAQEDVEEVPCFCCAPCLVAGLVIEPTALFNEETGNYDYEDEHIDYLAEILICQAPNSTLPKRVTVTEDRTTDGVPSRIERVVMAQDYGNHTILNAAYADFTRHEPGASVMVLVQPLYGFDQYPGIYSPCINNRQVADEAILLPKPSISTAYINSTGYSCQISTDEQMWDETYNDLEEPPVPPADDKYTFFRVLPITIQSCLS